MAVLPHKGPSRPAWGHRQTNHPRGPSSMLLFFFSSHNCSARPSHTRATAEHPLVHSSTGRRATAKTLKLHRQHRHKPHDIAALRKNAARTRPRGAELRRELTPQRVAPATIKRRQAEHRELRASAAALGAKSPRAAGNPAETEAEAAAEVGF
eukprot:1186344-Prorocentrum_minimum.AAC.3